MQKICFGLSTLALAVLLTACDDSGSGYDGCHGAGCLVDDPDSDDPNNWPLCSDGARHPDCSYAPLGY